MIAWAVETLFATTLLMVLVLLIRAPVRRAFGPGIAYALWALPVLRMLLPPMPQGWRGDALPVIAVVPQDITLYLGEPVAVLAAAPETGLGWPVIVIGLWAAGAIGFLAYHLIAYALFCARLRSRARRATLVAGGSVAVIESDAASGPLAFGIWRKYVAFPSDFAERYDEQERDLALAHELAHHARGDLVANWVALVVLAFHWFNPIAWRAFRAYRADQEMACDALVLSGRPQALRHAYGRAIVKSAHGGAVSAACHLHTINEIKGRLSMLTRHQKPSHGRWVAGIAATVSLTAAGLAATASSNAAAGELRSEVETHIGMPLDEIEITLPPIAPAMPAAAAPATPAAIPATAPKAPPVWPAAPLPPESVEDDRAVQVQRFTTPDGKTMVFRNHRYFNDADLQRKLADMRANLPDIRSIRCGRGEELVLNDRKGKKQITRICTDRIERRAAQAARQGAEAERRGADAERHANNAQQHAAETERHARRSALDSLAIARQTLESERNLTESQRREALAGIDEALAELRSNPGDD